MSEVTEPVCRGVKVSASSSGTVQIVKFNLQNSFHFKQQEWWDVPEGWTDEEIDAFVQARQEHVKERCEALAQPEQDSLLAASDWYSPED